MIKHTKADANANATKEDCECDEEADDVAAKEAMYPIHLSRHLINLIDRCLGDGWVNQRLSEAIVEPAWHGKRLFHLLHLNQPFTDR